MLLRRIRAADPLRQAKIFLAYRSPLFARLPGPGGPSPEMTSLRLIISGWKPAPGAVEPRIIATER